jgi:EAL domain-containing protein (putative c-di-GMP-specific phosphodiesterase class I)/GGDEF domain-containing protein
MQQMARAAPKALRGVLAAALGTPAVLAFLPAITLVAHWLGGELALLGAALGLPALFALLTPLARPAGQDGPRGDPVTGAALRDEVEAAIDRALTMPPGRTVVFAAELSEARRHAAQLGQADWDALLHAVATRLAGALRREDVLAHLGGGRFAAALAPGSRADLESALAVAGRLCAALEEPLLLGPRRLYPSLCVGLCLSSRIAPEAASGAMLIEAAEDALAEAVVQGPGTVRAFAQGRTRPAAAAAALVEEAALALEAEQVEPWFQPQISTDTGQISGFEALARWRHPERGILLPAEFLPALAQAGLTSRLGELMLAAACRTLRGWESAGFSVPRVAVNFAAEDLRDPALPDRVAWELDRHDLAPERLAIEVLETVVASDDDLVCRNLAALSALGCGIDLDDFGTGHSGIASIRRYSITRIKVDRRFVARIDEDEEQRRLVSAILTMADHLGVETLAEGVETAGEHALLAQLGCGHVQGFGLARPMPAEACPEWAARHAGKLAVPPRIPRRTG